MTTADAPPPGTVAATVSPPEPVETPGDESFSDRLVGDLRRLAAAATAGLLLGFLVNGVGSRLAMMLLANLNPEVTGLVSDDGFVMGQFTLSDTAGLVAFGTIIGALGGALYLVVRPLRFGPRWFQLASVSIGPAVVVGSMLVHPDGIDFRLLEPLWLAVGLFVLLPGLFALGVSLLVDRWLQPDAWPMRSRRWWAAGLVPLVALGPGLAFVAVAVAAHAGASSVERVRTIATAPAARNVVRAAFVVVFLLGLRALVADVVDLA